MAEGRLADKVAPRQGTADDVASAVLFLASDEARSITAALLPVDGGRSGRVGQA